MSGHEAKSRRLLLKSCAAALALFLLPVALSVALPDDRDQPIHISADQALRDEKQGITVYSGHVLMDQGSLHIEAERLTIYHEAAEADRVVAEGRPAHLRQQPEADKGPVLAYAGIIEYFHNEERVLLREDARIERDGAVVTGDSIDYLIAEQLVKADSDQKRQGNRVQVVIPAETLQQEGTGNGNTDSE